VRFAVTYMPADGNHGIHGLFDLGRYIQRGLEYLGHECSVAHGSLSSDAIPIVIGTHSHQTDGIVKTLRDNGPYILVQSEIVAKSAFPSLDGYALHSPQFMHPSHLKQFSLIHAPLMQNAIAVWACTAGSVATLEEVGVYAGLLRGGYLHAMEEVNHTVSKDIDALFYGSELKHRRRLLNTLRAKVVNVVSARGIEHDGRNALIARSRIVLAPNHGIDTDCLGWLKVCYLLNQRAIVCVERCFDQRPYEECFPSADTAGWVDMCCGLLARTDLDDLAESYLQRFKQIRFEDILRPLVDGVIVKLDKHTQISAVA
jgi:hypothetical protein